jgi:signal transduction histidine kinase
VARRREIDATLAFTEVRRMLTASGITREGVAPSDFDPPHAGPGAQFAISRGLLQAAGINEDLVTGEVVTADGRENFVEAIKEFGEKDTEMALLEVLACAGCISGPGIGNDAPLFRRRKHVSRYCRERGLLLDREQWRRNVERFSDLDLSRTFRPDDQRIPVPSEEEIAQIMERMGKTRPQDQLNCGSCGYGTCREHAIAIHSGLAESEMCLPYSIDRLQKAIQELAETQEALTQSEKLASMGQLAAGIAHELNNPLGVVLMYAHLMQRERTGDEKLSEDLHVVTEQADRCKKIVSGLLHFARQNKVLMQPTDVRDVIARSVKSVVIPGNVTVQIDPVVDDPNTELDRDQIVQVLVNLLNNACAAMPNGGVLRIGARGDDSRIEFRVTDTGTGIAKEHLGKIFEPFFTTKGIEKGTGLGLAISYGIVKMHSGDIRVESNADAAAGPTGSTFIVSIPRRGQT